MSTAIEWDARMMVSTTEFVLLAYAQFMILTFNDEGEDVDEEDFTDADFGGPLVNARPGGLLFVSPGDNGAYSPVTIELWTAEPHPPASGRTETVSWRPHGDTLRLCALMGASETVVSLRLPEWLEYWAHCFSRLADDAWERVDWPVAEGCPSEYLVRVTFEVAEEVESWRIQIWPVNMPDPPTRAAERAGYRPPVSSPTMENMVLMSYKGPDGEPVTPASRS